MQDVISMLKVIVPELEDYLNQRLQIMNHLKMFNSRIGRKKLAEEVNLTERSLRTTLDVLREQNLVDVNSQGIQLTNYGLSVLNQLDNLLLDYQPFYQQEQQMKQLLGIDHCRIVPGDVEEDDNVFTLISQLVQELLIGILDSSEPNVIAVTGGSTLARIGEDFSPRLTKHHDITFVPARGGVGGSFHIQSNTVGGVMSQQANAKYVPLFIPENIDQKMYDVLLSDASIRRAVQLSKQANALLLSVGTANVMAERRDISKEQIKLLIDGKAVGEAFGIFYNKDGEIILRLPRIGIQMEDLNQFPILMTIVAGSSKADALVAFYKMTHAHGWLICDEGVANTVLSGLKAR
ncbi:sugar-binding transcriptional regulator [Fundicoccus culcitae]|uniref:Sugar-binding domain-containing protein n=1 Tax=Fundicoccus culcitae TaxID=2969821 RepID=A0ABY5P659_9LACT|nr:sugar-binding domain-containing protein [Fundicoccus culcitae]UUX34206.1 sugar-binding domain-containing protein [Fundicoccus culcitae]